MAAPYYMMVGMVQLCSWQAGLYSDSKAQLHMWFPQVWLLCRTAIVRLIQAYKLRASGEREPI